MSARQSPDNRFLTAPVGRIFATTALPMVAIMTMNGLLGIVDAAFLGRFVGEEAIAAISIAFPILLVTIALSTLVGSGMSSLLARQLGAGAREEAGATFARAHGLAIMIGLTLILLFLVGGWTFATRMAGSAEPVARMAWVFLVITLLGTPLQFLLGIHADAWRNEGRAGSMALMSLGVTSINILFNYILIVPLAMGVAGSALSTVLAQGAGLALLVEGRRRSREMMPLGVLRRNAWHGQWGQIAALGAPVSLTFLGMALTATCVVLALPASGEGHSQAVAAYGIITRILGFAFLPPMAAALAMQSIVGNNVGAGRWDRAEQVLRIAVVTAFIYGAAVELLLLTQGRLIASAFIADAGVIEEVARILKPMAALYLFSGPVLVLALYFQAIGRPLQAGLLTLMKSFVLVPVAIIVIAALLDRTAIWFAFPIADGLTVAIAAVVLGAVAMRGGERMRRG